MAFGYRFWMQVDGVDQKPQVFGTRAQMMDYYNGLMDGAGLSGQARQDLDFAVMDQGLGDAIDFRFTLPDGRTVQYRSEGKEGIPR